LAVGATKQRILIQYLISSYFLIIISSSIGAFLSFFILYILNKIVHLNFVISFPALEAAFFITFVSGIIFGLYPAQKASNIAPMNALQEV